ncbi:MAG: methionine sulfoxide reductase [Bacteroidetes bacterium 43-93]|nr:GIY-YIG nuclease family protein [Bacteroidota bacterium]OJW97456.1 MAG: methionine sulfoxide reductase [Bacteroidetes bacterium 43-93]
MSNIFGKTIRIFLVDGTTNGLTTAELSNWTGIGIKVPRIKIREYSSRSEFQRPGVYILIGKDDSNGDSAYIGEAEVIYERLLQQISNKEFWNEVIFFGSKDKYLNKASVKYLESRLFEMAQGVGRYTLTQNTPSKPELSEAELAELEEFLSNIKVLTATLGHKIFESLVETIESNKVKEEVFYCKNGAGASGKGSPSTEGFVLFKDSLLIIQEQPSLTESIRNERKKMLGEGILMPQDNFYRLTKDYVFNSSSRAAAATLARSASGPLEWKTETGIQLKQFE